MIRVNIKDQVPVFHFGHKIIMYTPQPDKKAQIKHWISSKFELCQAGEWALKIIINLTDLKM